MINPGYKISTADISKIKDFRKSAAYSTYLRSLAVSPAYNFMMRECLGEINIGADLEKLKEQKKLPDNVSIDALNEVFKQSINRLAVGLMADTVIIREIEEIKTDEVIQSLKEDASVTYLLGMADEKYYKQASKLLEDGKLDYGSIEYRGLMAYIKRNGKVDTLTEPENSEPVEHFRKERKVKATVDLNSDAIRL